MLPSRDKELSSANGVTISALFSQLKLKAVLDMFAQKACDNSCNVEQRASFDLQHSSKPILSMTVSINEQ